MWHRRLFTSLNYAANLVKTGLQLPTVGLSVVELTRLRYQTRQPRKRDKERKKESEKHQTWSCQTDMRCSISTKVGTLIEEVRAIIAPLTFSDPIISLDAKGR